MENYVCTVQWVVPGALFIFYKMMVKNLIPLERLPVQAEGAHSIYGCRSLTETSAAASPE